VNILLLHQFYNTPVAGGALRSYYLACALAAAGIKVTVLTTHNHFSIKTTRENGVEVHYLPVTYDNRYGFFRRIFSFFGFVGSTVRYAGNFRHADIVYAISTPLTTGLAALWIKFRYRIPYYFEVGDLWPEAPVQMGVVKNPVLKWTLYKLERIIYRNAHAVVALSPAIKQAVEQTGKAKRVHLIPNMADTQFYHPEAKHGELEKKFNVEKSFVVSYIGTLGMANGLEYIVNCAVRSQAENLNIRFMVCGKGKVQEELERTIREKKLTHVSVIPHQSREGVKELLNVTDAVLVCYKPLPVLETGSPNKFFDGLAAGKLIIINFGGWIKEEIEAAGCGVAVNPADPADFIQKIKPFLSDNSILDAYQRQSRHLAETRYARHILGEAFTDLFKKPYFQQ
jgi:glycosyltransferase involved in cell wall biosynthesis